MSAADIYDTIGHGYARQRRPDPQIAAQLTAALGDAQSVLNVGAGSGSYEPPDWTVVAVEPSGVMVVQRPPGAAPAVRARAETLPFPDRAFDAVMAVLTLHHWADRTGGLAECARVARRRVVLLTWDPEADAFWLLQEYLPAFVEIDRRQLPPMSGYGEAFGPGAGRGRRGAGPARLRRRVSRCVLGAAGGLSRPGGAGGDLPIRPPGRGGGAGAAARGPGVGCVAGSARATPRGRGAGRRLPADRGPLAKPCGLTNRQCGSTVIPILKGELL